MRKARVSSALPGTNLMPTAPIPDDLKSRPIALTDNARTVLRKRYLRRGDDGKPNETEHEMFWRVAYHVALAETEYDGDVIAQARTYYDILTNLQFFPNSPTFTGAGTPLGQLAACFTADMRVTTSEGIKPIAELSVGDLALTHEGRYRPITEVYQRPYEGKLLKITTKLIGTPLEVTPEHPIMTPKGWVKAGELKVGDLVSHAVPMMIPAGIADQWGDVDEYQDASILSIEGENYTGTVYNCEVEEDHSYVTEGVIVHNCFVLAIEDDMGRHESGIFQTLRDAALIQQTGGGNGFAFSRLRPKGSLVKSSAGQATGPVGFLRVYDEAFGEIAQGGSRRGANMSVLKISHPDIREFITCKSVEGSISNFNISVGITDKFMRAVEADTDFELVNPQNGEVWETVRARELFDMIVKQAHHNGEPGVLFLDAANRANPVPHLYELESTNPCGEQFLGPFENCCLGSINLSKVHTDEGKVNWDLLQKLTEDTTRFLDDVVDANSYVPAVPQLAQAAHRVRRIGLGIMGLGDLMYHLGVRYGSEEGQEFAGQILEFVRYHCMKTSIELAKDRGAFPAIEGSIYDPENLKWDPPTPLFPFSRNWDRPALDWTKITKGIKKHGIRNGAQMTVAPTGTIATVSGCEAYGCEPVFALAYIRHVNDNGRDLQLQYTSPLLQKALEKAGLSESQIKPLIEEVNLKGSCQDIHGLPESVRHTFVVSADITVDEHIRMQAAMQAFVDNALSKTINAPEGATPEDVAKAYMLGWKLGCKGLTVYVTGSREKVVLETHATAKSKQAEPAQAVAISQPVQAQVVAQPNETYASMNSGTKKPRPRRLEGRTYRVGTPLGGTYITINENGEGKGQPFELFIHTSKAGSETAAVSEAIGRLSSLILRMASPIRQRDRLKQIVAQLEGIGGGRSTGFGAARVRSLPDGVAQALSEYLEETSHAPTAYEDEKPQPHEVSAGQMALPLPVRVIGDLCPECGEATLVNEEGCRKCYTCGFSEC